ncbi:MAG TPA: class I SAM-dependent methyltransferase, partial [Actinomycetota bacterium]|nr:class I SAM-dependent methyltransferase [Actinomycetota bacterium]
MEDTPRLYRDLASWWPLLSHPDDYADEADEYTDILRGAAERDVREVLELGSGGGNSASHLKGSFAMTL